MAIASWMIRGRSLRSGRFNRSRLDSDDENVQLDLSKDPKENVQEILSHVCQRQGVAEGKRLGYLNAFVKLVSQPSISISHLGYTIDELLCCLRAALVHEATQVRAAGLRAVRYLIQDEHDVRSLIRLQIPNLIARSVDLTLRNDLERIQAMRIMRRLLAISPSNFPVPLLRCLISLANGAAEVNDRMLRTALAMLCEICVLNPFLFMKCGGITPLVRNILDCGLPRVSESLVGCLLYLLDRPETRVVARLDLQCFAEPFCDYFTGKSSTTSTDKTKEEKELRERELRLYSSHTALLSVLRSWPGLLHFCSPCTNSGLRALVDILYLKQLEIRKAVLDLLYDLLGIPLPEWTDELSVALDAVDPSHPQDAWRLNEGFVAAEGKFVLPHLAKFRPNIVVQHLAALLQAFLDAGLLAAIVEVIVAEDTFLSVRATILLGQLLHMMHLFLPPECCNVTPPLPSLMWYAVGASVFEQSSSSAALSSSVNQTYNKILASVQPALTVTKANQQQAQASVAAMNQLHRLLKRRPAPASLFLAQILNSSSRYHSEARKAAREESQPSEVPEALAKSHVEEVSSSRRRRRFSESVLGIAGRGRYSKSKLQHLLAKESEDALKESGVLSNKDGFSWNWEIVRSILKTKSDSLLKLEDSSNRTFMKRLVHFYKPSSNRFSRVELGGSRKQTNTYTLAGLELLDVLLSAEEVEGSRLFGELLGDIYAQMEDILLAKSAHDCLFSPQHTNNSLCQDYFLFIGHMSQSRRGLILLESTGLLNLLQRIVASTNHDCYIKLIVSSLDYASPGLPRQILETVLKSSSESFRLYATQLMVVLLRARVPNFHEWGLSLVLNQLEDSSKSVRLTALNILDEACDEQLFLQSLAELRPKFNPEIERELLLEIRLAAVPIGFSHLEQTGFLSAQMNFWSEEFNYRYVRYIEGEIHDAMSLHQRGEDGHYSRRVSSAKHVVRDVFIPPHLYGQLTKLPQGYKLLFQDARVHSLLKTVKDQLCSSEQEILELKAALWAVAHIATGSSGLEWIANDGIVQSFVTIAQNCQVYSLRATAFYCIGLLATSSAGVDILARHGWMSVRHHRHERWPVIRKNLNSSTSSLILDKDDCLQTNMVADEIEIESSVEEDDSSLWDDSFSNNGVQFWNEASPISRDAPNRKACTLPHQKVAPEWPRKQQRSYSESQSGSPQLQQNMSSPVSLCLTSSSTGTAGAELQIGDVNNDSSTLTEVGKVCDEVKSRSTSCSDSGVCSCESTGVKQSGEKIQTLSPIPSSTSLNTLKSARLNDALTPLVNTSGHRLQEAHFRKTSLQESVMSEHLSPTHSVASGRLSQQDMAAYATLRSLQRLQRPQLPNLSSTLIHSLGMADKFLDDINLLSSFSEERQTSSFLSSIRRLKVRSLDRHSSHPVFSSFNPKISNEIFAEAPPVTNLASKSRPEVSLKDHSQCFMGISLPLSTCSLYPATKPLRSSNYSSNSFMNMSMHHLTFESEQDSGTAQCDKDKRDASIAFNESECVQETEVPELAQSIQLSSESDDELESEEGTGNRLERERGRGSRKSARSALSNKGSRSRLRRRRERSTGLSYTEVRPYHHQASLCLVCSLRLSHQLSSTLRERKISAGSYHVRTRTETESSCGTNEANESPSRLRTMSSGAFGGSLESTTSTETIGSTQDSLSGAPGMSRAVIRSEVMRHVECMSNPIWIKPCQQALLHSKQKHPQMLDDICLYSDLCESLASSNYRLQARRFLQEIFLDVSFSEIYEEAINILKLAPVGNNCSEALHSRGVPLSHSPGETLAFTSSVKPVENQVPVPLSMVLEELSGSEERRGSSSSGAPESITRHIEDIRDSLKIMEHSKKSNAQGGKKSFRKTESVMVEDLSHKESIVALTDESVNLRSKALIKPVTSTTECFNNKVEVKSNCDSSGLKVETEVEKPVRKTVFSLLSKKDVAPSTRPKSKGEDMSILLGSRMNEDATIHKTSSADTEESSSEVRPLERCTSSVDRNDIKPLSPSRSRKVATLCQPSLAILNPTANQADQ